MLPNSSNKFIDVLKTVWVRYNFKDDVNVTEIVEYIEHKDPGCMHLQDLNGFLNKEVIESTGQLKMPNGISTIEMFDLTNTDDPNAQFEPIWKNGE